jgi:hypothetical protein
VASRSSSDTVLVWQGSTPAGYSLVVERDTHNRWVATVAAASRSRNDSLEAAILESAGASVSRQWAARLAATIIARTATSGRTQSRS